MKKVLFFTSLLITIFGCGNSNQPTIPNSINISTPGTLSSLLTTKQVDTITNLTLTGTIDERDIEFLESKMQSLAVLDLSSSNVVSFDIYPANTLPAYSFVYSYNPVNGAVLGNVTLKSIKLPNSLSTIGNNSFESCSELSSLTIGKSVTSIEYNVCQGCINLKTLYCLNPNPPELSSFCFDNNGISYLLNIYVPSSSISSYKTAQNWSRFSSIIQPMPN